MHYILWALDLIYDYLYIFIFTFTPDAMYHSILSTLLCKYIAKKRDTLHAHISTKHEPSIVTFAISSRKRMGHWRNVLKQDMKTLDTTATYKKMQIHHQEQGQFENTHINWTWGYMIQVQSLWLQSKMEPQCKSSYACSAREYVQKKFKATSYCLKPHNQKDADWMVQTSKQAPEYLGVGWG